ncbi:MAG: ParB/RepB/Spo0J family partition protein [Clostridiales bacterium]|nr:ParB/RepB/Spo0J family partition protein [Clostridiales bacterium]
MFIKKASEIPISMIKANAEQPRQAFGEEQLLELRDSINEFGILQPLIVRKENNGDYLLIAGERRLRAATLAGLSKVPAVIKEATEEEVSLIALVENIQRENLGYIEEAKAYKRLMEKYGINQSELSEKLGKKQSTISNKIRILNLPSDIQEMLVQNKLTERHARALLKIDDNNLRRVIIDKIVKNHFNVKQTERIVDEYLNKKEQHEREKNKIRHISYKLYLNTLKKAFNDMKLVEQGATFAQEDLGEKLRVVITIPKGTEEVI